MEPRTPSSEVVRKARNEDCCFRGKASSGFIRIRAALQRYSKRFEIRVLRRGKEGRAEKPGLPSDRWLCPIPFTIELKNSNEYAVTAYTLPAQAGGYKITASATGVTTAHFTEKAIADGKRCR